MANKHKPQPTLALVNRYGLALALFMLILGVLGGLLAMFIAAPSLYNYPATLSALDARDGAQQTAQAQVAATLDAAAAALRQTEIALTALQGQQAGEQDRLFGALQNAISTAQALDQASTQSAGLLLVIAASQTALARQQADLDQTATQSAVQVLATRTASAILNVQQQTQVALDYAQTQAALQQNATQAQLSFQATQAALQQNATQGAPALPPISATPRP